jgi:hypothetical protein
MVVGRVDLRPGEAEVAQEVEARIAQLVRGDAEHLGAELLAERPLVEDEADVEGRGQRRLDLGDLLWAEAVADQRGVVYPRRVAERAVPDRVGDDLLDLRGGVAEVAQGLRNRAVDDLEVPAPGELLELHQREIGLDAGGVAVHHETDGPGRRDDGGLGVAVAVGLAEFQRLVPDRVGEVQEAAVRTVGVVERDRRHRQPLVVRHQAFCGPPVVAHDPQHGLGVVRIAREGAEFLGHFRDVA